MAVSPLSGGEQGRDPIPTAQLDWVVWEVWEVLSMAHPLASSFFLTRGFPTALLLSCFV